MHLNHTFAFKSSYFLLGKKESELFGNLTNVELICLLPHIFKVCTILTPVVAMHEFLLKVKNAKSKYNFSIEGSKLEYGIIEKCNIDSDLRSKIWRLVTSKR